MNSEFKTIYTNDKWSQNFHQFLEEIFHLYPEDKFHQLIKEQTIAFEKDEDIYKNVQSGLPKIKTFLSEFKYALPALKKQKKEMARQVLLLLQDKTEINGYLEIGSTGRYISTLKKHIKVNNPIYLTNDIAPSNAIGDIFERGQLAKLGTFEPLTYHPISNTFIADNSLDLVTCHIGLHHCPQNLLDAFISSIHQKLRNGGRFIMRDHDVNTPDMATFVSLVHTVFNLGLNVSWEQDQQEYKSFKSVDEWIKVVEAKGFHQYGSKILQKNDPSLNTLIGFQKI